jgi:rhodanese-related sulfurtransferase
MQVKELLEKKDAMGLFVLNVHAPYEGKLDKTDAIIEDWENIAAHADQLPEDKNQPILVYCRTGRMSTSAVGQLKSMGYTNLYHLNGGMRAWDGQGLPIIDKTFE